MRLTTSAALAAFLALPGLASAQDAIVEGPGIVVTDGTVLHPTVGAEAGLVDNLFFESEDGVLAPVLRILADLDIASRPPERLGDGPRAPQKIQFRAGAHFAYSEFLSSKETARAQRDIAISANADVQFFPEGTATLRIQDSFVRDTRPTNFESSESLDRDINHLQIKAGLQPGGRALYFGARYENIIDIFESSDSQFANRIQHTVGLHADWQFLPVTKFFFDGSLGFYDGLGSDAEGYKVSSNPLRLRVGAMSAITEAVTARVQAGFAKGFYSTGEDYTGAVVGAELGFRYSPLGRVTALYEHDYHDSINANYYRDHAFKLTLNQQILRVLMNLGAEARLRGYRGVPMEFGGDPTRDDVIFAVNAGLAYVFGDRYTATLDYRLAIDETDFRTVAGGSIDDPSYVRQEIFAGVTAAF